MKLSLLVVMMFLSLAPIAFAQRGNPRTLFAGQTPDQMIAEFMKEHDIPGMTLSIVQAPYVSRVVGYGVADVERGLLAAPNTLWALGEMTQAYTAVAVMQLVESGALSVDDAIGKHLPDLPTEWNALTVRQLLAHASGLADYSRQARFDAAKEYTPAEIVGLIGSLPLDFKPGTRVARSATNFYLLGLVIEKASGLTYQDFITKGQIEPLGLTHTIFPSQVPNVKQESLNPGEKHGRFLAERGYIDPTEVASGYVDKDGERIRVPPSQQSALFANGALLASATDISLWDIGLAGGILVKNPENRAFLYHGIKLEDGTPVAAHCGWRFPAHPGLMDITGNAPGFSVYLSRFTDKAELVCVTLCANKGGVDLTELARRVAGCFDERLGPPADPKVMTCLESCFPASVTMDRLERFLTEKGVGIAARVNHSAAAKMANLDLRPTETLVFGNPAVGTHLMLSQQRIALDLPLRAAVWRDEKGSVWLGWHDIAKIAAEHGITDQVDLLAKMNAALAAAARHATSPY